MPFVKGQPSTNPKGRPKGKSIAQMEKKGLVEYLKREGADKFIEALHTLEGKEYCQTYIPVVELAFPKQARIETKTEVDAKVQITWDHE